MTVAVWSVIAIVILYYSNQLDSKLIEVCSNYLLCSQELLQLLDQLPLIAVQLKLIASSGERQSGDGEYILALVVRSQYKLITSCVIILLIIKLLHTSSAQSARNCP